METILLYMLLLSVLSLVLGLYLMAKGSPYGKILTTLHKLSSFTVGVLFCIIIYMQFKQNGIMFPPLLFAILTIVVFIISVTIGSILISVEAINPKMKIVHRITSCATYIFIIVSLYSLNIFR